MGYAFLNEQKIHGVFNKPVKFSGAAFDSFPLLKKEGTAIELGLSSEVNAEGTTYPVYLFEEIGFVRGIGKRWNNINLDGVITEGFTSRRAAALSLGESYLSRFSS